MFLILIFALAGEPREVRVPMVGATLMACQWPPAVQAEVERHRLPGETLLSARCRA